ncbi:MAG: caspase family protein [Sedimentitalea sp.]|uniref:caspase family protein n=1 Tax=Sedimentitalea sp. TaxID=2048915 RepID=UPI003266F621
MGTIAHAQDRVALVIGNSNYERVGSLENPQNDADDIGAALARLGFAVTSTFNLDSRSMNLALRDFSRSARNAEMALIYFAGHGMEIDRRNFLIPVDAILEQSSDVTFEAIEMQKFLSAVRGAKTLRLVLLDACRDNPFLRQIADAGTRSLGRGLGAIEPASGVLVGYSAKGGTVALDGSGRNSPYAAALLAHLETPGLEIGQLFRRVRDTVLTNTNGQQEPFTYGSLPAQDLYLAVNKPDGPTASEVLQAFLAADTENSVSDWRDFIEKYANAEDGGQVVERARQRLAALASAPEAAPVPSDEQPSSASKLLYSPLVRACDQLAADPNDTDRPADAPGIGLEAIDPNSAVTACILAASGHPDNGRSRYQLARALKAAGRIDEAHQQLVLAVDTGYPAALVSLGSSLLDHPGSLEEAQKTVNILDAAIDAGNATAARHLGDFFSRPASTITLKGRSPLEYYSIAAKAGDPLAMYEAGYRLVSSRSTSLDQKRKGVSWLSTSADMGVHKSAMRLANFLLAPSTPIELQDASRAIALLEARAEDGDAELAHALARRYRLGEGVDPDLSQSVRWASISASLGSAIGVVENGYNHEIGRGGFKADSELAAQSYFDALRKGARLPYIRQMDDWPRDVALALQRLLGRSSQARYRGPIDGLVGARTRNAMKRLCSCTSATATADFAWLFRETDTAPD